MKFSPLNLLTNLALKRIGERKIKLCLCRSFSVGTLGTLFFSCGCDWYFCKFYRKHKNTFQIWHHYKPVNQLLETQNLLSFSNRKIIKSATFTQKTISKYQQICTYWKYFLYISRFGIFVNSCIVKNGGGSNIWAHQSSSFWPYYALCQCSREFATLRISCRKQQFPRNEKQKIYILRPDPISSLYVPFQMNPDSNKKRIRDKQCFGITIILNYFRICS